MTSQQPFVRFQVLKGYDFRIFRSEGGGCRGRSCCGSGILRTTMNGTNLDGEMKQEEVIYLAGDVPTPGVLFPVFCAFDSFLQLFLSAAHRLQAEDKTK